MEDWRRIDIDALEADNFLTKEELVPSIDSNLSLQDISNIINECRNYLTKGKFLESLQLGLDNPPYLFDQSVKDQYNELMFEVLCSIKNNNNDVSPIIKNLSTKQQDVLIKYLYKIMNTSYGSKQGGLMLVWFEKTIEITGLGPIIRFMSDRRTV
ncbi:actin-related protein 2/3 complex subunit 5 [[Candida] jaroonii]|uniref:Actin-related protein 2/3 complex subunit 5 n=1 Tax=[Candida] jaroonii TaxID=467808 RepID=A0ACA9Y6U6_9ASCO|nr:actin-related protein 2/3 complex subunit 5 [[Candida] jaroonii]